MNARFDHEQLARTWRLADRWVEQGEVPAVSIAAGGARSDISRHHAGRQTLDGSQQLDPDAIFLIASPTKPVTALAVMTLVEAGELLVSDPVAKYVPEFGNAGKQAITLAHCLTHTSGLPDMLPDNVELRKRHAPLSEFVAGTCKVTPLFEPGTAVKYQSMGTLMLAEVVRRVSGVSISKFLDERVFKPLQMHDTALGMPQAWTKQGAESHGSRRERIAEIRVPAEQVGSDWGWNSDYWRSLGAPWGGLLSTARDWATLCRHLLKIHAGEPGILSRTALVTMTTNQLARLPEVPEVERRCRPWGYGWRLNCFNDDDALGDFLSPSAFGHWGATGTLVWMDPGLDAFAVILTSEPLQSGGRRHARLTNCLVRALQSAP